MQRLHRLLLASPLFFAAGCGAIGSTHVARVRGASELGCPESKVNVRPVAGNGYVAYGCGKSVRMTCLTTTNPSPFVPGASDSQVSCVSGDPHDEGPDVTVEQVNAWHAKQRKEAAAKAAAEDGD